MNRTLAVGCLLTLGAICAPTGALLQDSPLAKPVMLKRVYKVSEKQAYTFSMTIGEGEQEFRMAGSFSLAVKKVEPSGQAEIEIESTKLKFTFGGDEQDAPELPKPTTISFDLFGLPTKMDLGEEANPAIGTLMVCYLPSKAVALGGAYDIKWESSDGYKLEGKGKLIATGMLYEEHVAKIEFEGKTTDKDGGEGTIAGTLYSNLESGKLVKAEGTAEFLAEGEKSKGKLLIAKVRQK